LVELFKIGHISVYLFGLMIAIAIIVGLLLAYKEAIRKGIDANEYLDFLLYLVLFGIIGGRLGYIIFFNPKYFISHPLDIIKINNGGMSIQGAIMFATLFAIWYTKKHNKNFWVFADIVAPSLALGQAIGRIGCDVFGVPMSKKWFWGVPYNGQWVHPAQVYEFTLDYILFFVLWRKRKNVDYNGQLILWYLIFFSVNRGIVEFFRTNTIVFGPFSIAHVLSAVIIVAGLCAMYVLKKRSRDEVKGNEVVSRGEAIEDGLIVTLLYIISLMIYYGIRRGFVL